MSKNKCLKCSRNANFSDFTLCAVHFSAKTEAAYRKKTEGSNVVKLALIRDKKRSLRESLAG